jgi:hypothetical protein
MQLQDLLQFWLCAVRVWHTLLVLDGQRLALSGRALHAGRHSATWRLHLRHLRHLRHLLRARHLRHLLHLLRARHLLRAHHHAIGALRRRVAGIQGHHRLGIHLPRALRLSHSLGALHSSAHLLRASATVSNSTPGAQTVSGRTLSRAPQHARRRVVLRPVHTGWVGGNTGYY